jgi:hypothetical protein
MRCILTVWVTGALSVNRLTIVVVLVKTLNGIVVMVATTYKVLENISHNRSGLRGIELTSEVTTEVTVAALEMMTVDVGVGIERQLHAEEMTELMVYFAKQDGLATLDVARFCFRHTLPPT